MIVHEIAELHLHWAISLIVDLCIRIITSLTSLQHTRNYDVIKSAELNDRIYGTKLMSSVLLLL